MSDPKERIIERVNRFRKISEEISRVSKEERDKREKKLKETNN